MNPQQQDNEDEENKTMTQTLSLSAAIAVIEARDNYVDNHEDGRTLVFLDDLEYAKLEATADRARLYIQRRMHAEPRLTVTCVDEIEVARNLLANGVPDSK